MTAASGKCTRAVTPGALIATIVSAKLGDVMGQTIGIGTISSVIAGIAGGAIGHRNPSLGVTT